MGWFVNEFPKYVFLFIWLGLNIFLFIWDYIRFDTEERFVYLKFIVRNGLQTARGSALMLNFNCMLILLPVCRNLLSLVRDIPCLPSFLGRLLDKNITFHRLVAYMICLATALHTGAHIYNFEALIASWEDPDLLVKQLNAYSDEVANQTRLNPIREEGLDPIIELLKTVAGVSGVVITLALIVMVSSSTELIRRSYFEVFWFTHHLFIIFFIGVIVHGVGELLRSQSNFKYHEPKFCVNIDPANWTDHDKCKIRPSFAAAGPQTWKWVVGPLFLYLVERCIRFYRSFQTCEVKKVVKHPSKVIEIQMRKPGFKAEAGQYIFLHCPSISYLEWHPFTLTSCPEEDFFSVHIRIVGDWTEALSKACGDGKSIVDVSKFPRLACDGPFGTASTDVFYHETVICVGAGIGVTPFASILKSIWYRHRDQDAKLKIKKVYFFWICPDTNAFEWFSDLLQSLEQQMHDKGLTDFLDYNIYLTRGWDKGVARNIALHEESETDVITGLKQKTNYGRPNWDSIFQDVANKHKGRVGVFFCGPAVLSHTLHQMSNKHSGSGTRFYYNKENF